MSDVRATIVSAVVPTHNNRDELAHCVQSLQAQTYALARIIVCVDGSTDGTLDYLAGLANAGRATIRVRTHPGNVHHGLAATRNLALDVLDGEYVWYVDSDMVVAPDALEQHLLMAQERDCISQGQVVYLNADDGPWAGYLETRAHHRAADRAEIPFTWFSGANVLIPASLVRQVGGFDARFVSYGGEEFDFAYRLQRMSGGSLVYNKRAVASTIENKSVEDALTQLERYGATNLHLLERLHHDMPRTFELGRLESGPSLTGPSWPQ